MPMCQVCQKDNPTGAEYCEDCGAALTGATTTMTPVTPPAEPGPAASPTGGSPTSTGGAAAPSAPATPPLPAESTAAPPTPPGVGSDAAAPPVATEASSAGGPPSADPSTAAPGTPAPAVEQRARLVALRYGAPSGEEIPLLGQRLVVGRFDPETGPVDIDLSSVGESVHISRQHGELYREGDGKWVVRDLGSTNGVFVKGGTDASFGPRITAPRPLANGDELSFGNARFIFKTE